MDDSDEKLVEYLSECRAVELHTLIGLMESTLSPSSEELAEEHRAPGSIPRARTKERRQLALSVVRLLKWYGSNALAYGVRSLIRDEPGVAYHVIVRDVATRTNGSLKKKDRARLPRVATVAEWEEIVVGLLFTAAFKEKSSEEIATMLREAGLGSDAAKRAAKTFGPGLAGLALPVLVRTLGKKTVTILLKKMVVAVMYRRTGKEADKVLAGRLLGKLAQRFWARLISGLGWAIVAVDVLGFATSLASRITVPTVAATSVFRMKARVRDI